MNTSQPRVDTEKGKPTCNTDMKVITKASKFQVQYQIVLKQSDNQSVNSKKC